MKNKLIKLLFTLSFLLLALYFFTGCKPNKDKNKYTFENVSVSYKEDPRKVLIDNIENTNIVISGYDKELLTARIINQVTVDDMVKVTIEFVDKSSNVVFKHDYEISNFLTTNKVRNYLNDLSQKLVLKYPNIDKVVINDFDSTKVIIENNDDNCQIQVTRYVINKTDVTIDLLLKSKLAPSIEITRQYKLQGFKQLDAQRLLDYTAQTLSIELLKEPTKYQFSDLAISDFKFQENLPYKVINQKLTLEANLVNFSYQIENSANNLTSKVIVKQYEYKDYYLSVLNQAVTTLKLNETILNFNEVNANNLQSSFTGLLNNHELVITDFKKGLYTISFKYHLVLKSTDIASEVQVFTSNKFSLPDNLKGIQGRYLKTDYASFLLSLHDIDQPYLTPSIVAKRIKTTTYNDVNYNLTPLIINDETGTLKLLVTNNQNNLEETLNICDMTLVSESDIDVFNVTSVTFKNNNYDYLLSNFHKYAEFNCDNSDKAKPFLSYFSFPETLKGKLGTIELNNCNASYLITKIELLGNNKLGINYQISIPLVNYDQESNIDTTKDHLIFVRVKKDEVTFPSTQDILTFLTRNINPTILINKDYPSYYYKRFKVSSKFINYLLEYNDINLINDTATYFSPSDILIIKIIKCQPNDLTGELHLGVTLTLEDNLGVEKGTSKEIDITIKELLIISNVLENFNLKCGNLLDESANQKEAFNKLIKKYQDDQQTGLVTYNRDLVNPKFIAINENIICWDEMTKDFSLEDGFTLMINKGKIILRFKDTAINYGADNAIALDNKYKFMPAQVKITLNNVSVLDNGGHYDIRLNYQLSIVCFNASNNNSNSTEILNSSPSIELSIPKGVFA